MSKDAICEVRKRKHEIQAELWQMLNKFTEETGLIVSSIDVSHMETFVVGDLHKNHGAYEVQVNVTV